MNMRLKCLSILAVSVLALLCAPNASATIELKISDGINPTIDILDNSPVCGVQPCDSNSAVNAVTWIGTIGDWDLNVSTGTSKDKSFPVLLDLNSTEHHAGSLTPSTLTIQLSDNGFTGAQSGLSFSIGGTLSTGGTLTATAFGGTNNTKFSTSNPIGVPLTFTGGIGHFGNTTGSSFAGVSPYALTIITEVSFGTAAGQVSYDAALDPIPEPATVALLGGALLLSVGMIRRRARRL